MNISDRYAPQLLRKLLWAIYLMCGLLSIIRVLDLTRVPDSEIRHNVDYERQIPDDMDCAYNNI